MITALFKINILTYLRNILTNTGHARNFCMTSKLNFPEAGTFLTTSTVKIWIYRPGGLRPVTFLCSCVPAHKELAHWAQLLHKNSYFGQNRSRWVGRKTAYLHLSWIWFQLVRLNCMGNWSSDFSLYGCVVSTNTTKCLKRLVSSMTCYQWRIQGGHMPTSPCPVGGRVAQGEKTSA